MLMIRPLFLSIFLHTLASCEASQSANRLGGLNIRRDSDVAVKSPDETEEDIASFMAASMDLQLSPGSVPVAGADPAMSPGAPTSTQASVSVQPDADLNAWEITFNTGVQESKKITDAEDSDGGSWRFDAGASKAAVPVRMLRAEELMQTAIELAPTERWKEKMAERALRIYYHARWLAERNFAKAAEHRYREAAQLARSCRRSVLASHALARLGYFMLHWKREAEAVDVLKESMKLSSKSNPLAPYLHGVLERKAAGGDVERLRSAENAILNAGEQPSDELEAERRHVVGDIEYWRQAELSPKHCIAAADAAFMTICFLSHISTLIR